MKQVTLFVPDTSRELIITLVYADGKGNGQTENVVLRKVENGHVLRIPRAGEVEILREFYGEDGGADDGSV